MNVQPAVIIKVYTNVECEFLISRKTIFDLSKAFDLYVTLYHLVFLSNAVASVWDRPDPTHLKHQIILKTGPDLI